jgi:MYXO-CTERM domain-containing protein
LDTNFAWNFHLNSGYQNSYFQYNDSFAIAVRTGDVAAVPEADTWAMLLAGLGLVGVAARRRRG